jgi:hypothetical protein
MTPHRRQAGFGQAVLLAVANLAVAALGCRGDTSAHDSGAPTDAACDPSQEPAVADTGAGAADAPMETVRDGAGSPVPDVGDGPLPPAADGPSPEALAVDTGQSDRSGDETLASDGASAAERGASDPPAAKDGAADVIDGQMRDTSPDLLVDPACAGADSDGFFASCSSCTNPGNCDSVTVGSRTRLACGCEYDSDCPCGLTCGCYAIAASVQVCGICTR